MASRGDRGRGSDRGRGFDRGRGAPRGTPANRGGRGGFDSGSAGRGSPAIRGRGGFDSGSGGRGSPVNFERSSPSPSGFRGGDRGGRGDFRGGDRGGRGFDRGGRGFDRGGRGFDRGRGRGNFGAPRVQGGVFLANQAANIDARIADDSDKALITTRLRSPQLSNDPDSMPLRPDFGTVGQPIKLRTNFFPVRIPRESLNEYYIVITPIAGTATRRVKHRIFQLAEQTASWRQAGMSGTVAHDSSARLISARVLAQPLTIKVPYYDDDKTGPLPKRGKKYKEYTLTITFLQKINTRDLMSYLNGSIRYRNYNTLPIISALNIILAAHPLRSGIKVGQDRYFFRSAATPQHLGGGVEAWKGFYSSVRLAHRQLMVNVNVCTTAFYTPGNLAVRMKEFEASSFGARMEAFCRGIRVKTTRLQYRKTVKCLARQNARQHTFQCDELGGPLTVEEYFLRRGEKKYLPAELCEILPDQHFRGKLTDEHTARMITVACQPPNVNGNVIVNTGLNELGFSNPGSILNSFGVSVGPDMAIVPGRILPKPGLEYANNVSPSVDDRASWNLRNVRFAMGASLDKWAVLLIGDGNQRAEFQGPQDPALGTVINDFMGMCRTSGMNVGRDQPSIVVANLPRVDRSDPLRKKAITVINDELRKLKAPPSIVLVMLSSGDKNIYEGLKHLCDVRLGVATVCVQVAKIRKERGQLQYLANVVLKMNTKLGGINHKLDENTSRWISSVPTMVVGMDVTHPGPGSVRGTPSIAAVVASVDNQFAQYPASLDIQQSRKEMITNLKDMMVARLQLYRQHSKTLPQRVLVYREAVSEGKFDTVLIEELPEIFRAFHAFDQPKTPYRPKLAIVICSKMHHTRFYPTERKDAAGDGNPMPGTVVDRGITAVYEFDFFLQAHGGLQGTTKPTHYYVVHDEIGFKADELQGLTNALSYMFARATKAVSLVSPAYYADVACKRGRCYLRKLLQGHADDSTTASDTASASEENVIKEAKGLWGTGVSHSRLKDTMFYL